MKRSKHVTGICILTLLLIASCRSPTIASMPTDREEEDARMKADYERLVSAHVIPIELVDPFIVHTGSIIGVWEKVWYFHTPSTVVEVTQAEDEEYMFHLKTGGSLDAWELTRSATYSNGVLTLDKPAQWYASIPFQRLYLLRIPSGLEFLIPDTGILGLEEVVSEEGAERLSGSIHMFSLLRQKIPECPNKGSEVILVP